MKTLPTITVIAALALGLSSIAEAGRRDRGPSVPDRLVEELQLSGAQVASIEELRLAHRSETRRLRMESAAVQDQIRVAVDDSEVSDAQLGVMMRQLSDLKRQKRAIGEAHRTEIETILDPEQVERFEEILEERPPRKRRRR